jgi:hypothetical protein
VCTNNDMFSALQVLLVLVAFACAVLADPQGAEVYRPTGRPRLLGPYYRRPYDPTVIVGDRRRPLPRLPVRPSTPAPIAGPIVIPQLAPLLLISPAGPVAAGR